MSEEGMKSSTSPIYLALTLCISFIHVFICIFLSYSLIRNWQVKVNISLSSMSYSSKLVKSKDCTRTPLMIQTVKNLPAMQALQETGSIPGLGRSLAEENGYSLQYSCLENPWTKEPAVRGVTVSHIQLNEGSRAVFLESAIYSWWSEDHPGDNLGLRLVSEVRVNQSDETKPLTCGIWCYLPVDNVTIELNSGKPSGIAETAWCEENLHTLGDQRWSVLRE